MFYIKGFLNKSTFIFLLFLLSFSVDSNAMTLGLHSSSDSSGFVMHDGSTRYILTRGSGRNLGAIAYHSLSGGSFYTGFGFAANIPTGGISFGGGANGAFSLADRITLQAPAGIEMEISSITFYAEVVFAVSTRSATSVNTSNSFGIKFDI